MSEATPRPWHTGGDGGRIIYDADGKPIASATIYLNTSRDEMTANAALVVRAVNRDHLFDELVQACKLFEAYDIDDTDGDSVATMLNYADAKEAIFAVLAKINALETSI